MSFEQIISDLKNKIYKPIYFLSGEEPYFIDLITKYINDNVLTDAEKSFNQTVLYGKETELHTVINTAKRFPMMANHQVVIVKEAQNIKNIEELIHYATTPLKSTVLVINYKYKTLDKRKKLYKVLNENSVLFESKKLYDNEVPGWINGYLKKKNRTIDPSAGMLLTEYLGNDLSKVANELDKLIITLPDGEFNITTSHIERNIGISKDYNNFELHKALTQKNVLKANRIVNYFGHNPKDNPFTLTISTLYHFYSKVLTYHFIKDKRDRRSIAATLKVNPFFVGDYEKAAKNYNPKKTVEVISMLREYDLKSKGYNNVSTSHGELLKELVYKILHQNYKMTIFLIIITSAITILAFNSRELFEKLQLNPYAVYHKKEWHRIVSHGFLHANWIHLFINMFVLYSFGNSVERIFRELANQGIIKSSVLSFVILYFTSMIFATVTSIIKNKDNSWYNSVGASGAVSAVVFTHIFFYPLHPIELYAIIPIPGIVLGVAYLAYSHYMSRRDKDNVNHDAHFIGAVFGLLFPIVLDPKLINVFLGQLFNFLQ